MVSDVAMDDFTALLVAIILALSPVSEVRGAIPYVVITLHDSTVRAVGVVVSIASNMLVPIIGYRVLDLLDRLVRSKFAPGTVKRTYDRLLKLGRKRALHLKKESYAALALFVGVPLPFTGAWTGTLVAYVLGLTRWKAIVAISVGVLMASIIVLIGSYLGVEFIAKLLFLS
jgi:uncharacterized membrane protein